MRKSLVSASLVLALSSTVWAWEADVHYGLTLWLAVKAGFRPQIAEQIAAADLSADQGTFLPAPWAVGFHILILGDVQASESIQELHFPSYGPVPGTPKERSVPLDSRRAHDWLQKDTQFPTTLDNESSELKNFGHALHSLQDSWSHEGEPDVAFRCFGIQPRSKLSWAHPIERGGWAVHDADLTYLWKSDKKNRPIDMAHATFDALVAYAGKHPSLRQHQPADWSTLELSVRTFIEAETKDGKRAWFNADTDVPFPSYREKFVEGLSLPTSKATPRTINALQSIKWTCDKSTDVVADIVRKADRIPPEVRSFLDKFFQQWLVDRNIETVVKEMVDLSEIKRELQGFGGIAERPQLWAQKFLTMWLLSDHGFVNENGHGVPTAPGFASLPLLPSSEPAPSARYGSVDAAIIAPGTGTSYQVDAVEWPPVPGTSFVVTFRFKGQAHDALVLVARQVGQAIRIVRMFWLVD